MKAFKFTIGPTFVTLPSDPQYTVANCAAVVIADDREAAMALLRADLLAHGDVPWCDVATVTEFDLEDRHEIPVPAFVVLVVQG